ncbi:MAG: phosphonopyruvate decarboxylase [Arcticibacterium sp.]|jgi:phosphonopyruvate decarboxylase
MINPANFYRELLENKVDFFSGVPDSLLKDICAYISDNAPKERHIIAANEGASVGLACGSYLATGKIPLVYMQNSGFGNTINPLTSIADKEVYGIPMILLIGWRGEPGMKDEPQHVKQGRISEDLLKTLEIPYQVLDANSDCKLIIKKAISVARDQKAPVAILVKSGAFGKYSLQDEQTTNYPLNREGAVNLIVKILEKEDIVVSTTGKTSRELFENREARGESHEKDFLTVGAMGHTSSIAVGIAIEKPDRNIYCLDGDGSLIMHMGSLAINGCMTNLKNFKHIVINNGAHDSVGGQPTLAFDIRLTDIASACGYTYIDKASSVEEITKKLDILKRHSGRGFLEIIVNKGARTGLGRPTKTPKQNKEAFETFVK